MALIQEIFPGRIQKKMECLCSKLSMIQEIRIRVNAPIIIRSCGKEYFISPQGDLTNSIHEGECFTQKDVEEIILHICHSSLYAYEEELKRGYISMPGGHRVGIAGQAVIDEYGMIKTISNISFLNIRIAHEMIGVGNEILPYIYHNEKILNTLIISPPGYGKTTLLRDLIRQVSEGNRYGKGRNCCVIDERSEIAGSYRGAPQMQIGRRTDILDTCPKAIGMMMAIRSMGPQVIAVDELGTRADIEALFSVIRCGCNIFATIHGDDIHMLKRGSFLKEIVQEKVFERYIVIQNGQHDFLVYDGEFQKC